MITFLRKTLNKLLGAVAGAGAKSRSAAEKESAGPQIAPMVIVAGASPVGREPLDRRKRRKPPHPRPKVEKHRGRSVRAEKTEPLSLPVLEVIAPAEGKTRFADLDIAPEVLYGIQDLKFHLR